MVIRRGEIWWIDLDDPSGSEAGYSRPAVIVQDDAINASRLKTTVIVPLTSNTAHATLDTNVLLPAGSTRLKKDCVAVTTLVTAIDRDQLRQRVQVLPSDLMEQIEFALMTTLSLIV